MSDSLSRIKNACAFVSAGERRGTGYLIGPDLAVTCEHVVRDVPTDHTVKLNFPSGIREARIEWTSAESDTALLRLGSSVNGTLPLPISRPCVRGAPWEAYGFPTITGTSGTWLTGDIQDPDGRDPAGRQAIVLFSREVASGAGPHLQGISGTPVLVDGAVIGHLKRIVPDESPLPRAQLGTLYASSTSSLGNLLQNDADTPNEQVFQPPRAAFDPTWYVARKKEERDALNYLSSAGSPAVIWGPEGLGKTWLLRRIVEKFLSGNDKHRVVHLNLDLFDSVQRSSIDGLLHAWAMQIAEDLELDTQIDWSPEYTPTVRMTRFMRAALRAEGDQVVTIAIDRADALADVPYYKDLLGMLRGWADNKANPWNRLRLMLAVSTTPAQLMPDVKQSPFNLSVPIRLADFNEAQTSGLAGLYGFSLNAIDLRRLMSWIGGHPYLLRLAMYRAAVEEVNVAELVDSRGSEVFQPYLDGWRVRFMRDPHFSDAFSKVLGGGAKPTREIAYRLERAGLIVEESRKYRPRYKIYHLLGE